MQDRAPQDLANVLERLSTYGHTSTSIVLGTLVASRNPLSVQAAEPAEVTPAKRPVVREAARRGKDEVVVICFSGRGDKDCEEVARLEEGK